MIEIKGNCVYANFNANSLTDHNVAITLPDGYSYEIIRILRASNISTIYAPYILAQGELEFPAVNSKSPCKMVFHITDLTKQAQIFILITKFGQIPDPNYFDKAFDPILVTGDNGEKYKVIPSNQFK